MKIAVFLVLVLGMGTAQASRNLQKSEFITKAIKRIAQSQTRAELPSDGMKLPLLPSALFSSAIDLREELITSRDWDSLVENLFATFDPDKFDQLTQMYGPQSGSSETRSQKNWLHKLLLNGAIEVANEMVEMGLELDKVDLQGLLLYALQESPHDSRNSKAHRWWDWLVAHGARVDEPQIVELFKYAALTNDVHMLDWLRDNLLTDTAVDRAIFASSLNVALPLTPRTGAGQAAIWLLKHGADVSAPEETELLQAVMFRELVDTGNISVSLAHYISKSGHEHLLSEVLDKIVSDAAYEGI